MNSQGQFERYLFFLRPRGVSTRASWTGLVFLICRYDAQTHTNCSIYYALLISRIKSVA